MGLPAASQPFSDNGAERQNFLQVELFQMSFFLFYYKPTPKSEKRCLPLMKRAARS